MQHDRLFLFLITNILLCNSRRIRVRGRYAVFLHHQHIHGYSTVEGTSRVQQSFHVRFARLSASGASAFIFASLLQQPMQNERGKFATIQLWMRIPFNATTQATCTKNVSRIHDDLLLSSLNESSIFLSLISLVWFNLSALWKFITINLLLPFKSKASNYNFFFKKLNLYFIIS